MKAKITEVHNYFAEKIAKGLYVVDEINEKYIHITVDNEYKFGLWISDREKYFSIVSIGLASFMMIEFTNKQKKAGYKKAYIHIKFYINTELRKTELAELKKLKEKYPDIK